VNHYWLFYFSLLLNQCDQFILAAWIFCRNNQINLVLQGCRATDLDVEGVHSFG
jgi:hypothetical protein